MTLKELYASIGGDYDQALRVLRVEKLINKHICKLEKNGLFDDLREAGANMDETELFEKSHAIKGVCGNLGLTELASCASEISDEFRPGANRSFTDEEVKEKLQHIDDLYQKTKDGIKEYEASK
jgi:HPt (histidine-containing phosphotransfer) domain-containing protein